MCPDGSIFVVQRPESIPCANAKQVEPGEVPPLKPELLPRPYAWEVFNQQQNPNNPYNLIDAARQVRESRAAEAAATSAPREPVPAGALGAGRVEPAAGAGSRGRRRARPRTPPLRSTSDSATRRRATWR